MENETTKAAKQIARRILGRRISHAKFQSWEAEHHADVACEAATRLHGKSLGATLAARIRATTDFKVSQLLSDDDDRLFASLVGK